MILLASSPIPLRSVFQQFSRPSTSSVTFLTALSTTSTFAAEHSPRRSALSSSTTVPRQRRSFHKRIAKNPPLSTKMSAPKVGFLGGGMMAEALIGGILQKNIAKPSDLLVNDIATARLTYLNEKFGVGTIADPIELVQKSEVVILAVKPQSFEQLAADLQKIGNMPEGIVFCSIMAGVTLDSLSAHLGSVPDIVRVMPNTPALYGLAASAYCVQEPLSHPELAQPRIDFVDKIFSAIGTCSKLPNEKLMDAVTGLSGSGPAYVYMLIEAMADGGVKMGLPRAMALELAAQTVHGASKMVLATGSHPGVLRNNVESPGGTTIHGTAALEAGGFRQAVIAAVQAATERSAELGAAAAKK